MMWERCDCGMGKASELLNSIPLWQAGVDGDACVKALMTESFM
jgi:hypothetical protein